MADLQDIHTFLKQAHYFNGLWHDMIDKLYQEPTTNIDEVQRQLYEAQVSLFLQQKTDCQITALHMAYHHALENNLSYDECQVVLQYDPNEKGISGDGVFYGLYPKNEFKLACHIPKDELLNHLTVKQQQFFNLI